MSRESTSRTEMVGVKPRKEGRIVVNTENVAAFEDVGYIVIEKTSLPLSGIAVPGKKAVEKPEPAPEPKTEDAADDAEELLAKINKANTPQLKALAIQLGLNVNLDEFDDVTARRDIVANMLGLTEDDDQDEDEDEEDA